MRWKVWFATSISVWQHVKLSRYVPEIYLHVAGMLSNQTNKLSSPLSVQHAHMNLHTTVIPPTHTCWIVLTYISEQAFYDLNVYLQAMSVVQCVTCALGVLIIVFSSGTRMNLFLQDDGLGMWLYLMKCSSAIFACLLFLFCFVCLFVCFFWGERFGGNIVLTWSKLSPSSSATTL